MNDLGIDPHNFKFDFGRDWTLFRDSRVRKFLVLYLQRQVELGRSDLENSSTPDDLRVAQGGIRANRHMLTLLGMLQVEEKVKEVITFIEK